MTWVWHHCTVAEAFYLLEFAERRMHAQLALSLSGQALAASAGWSRRAGESFDSYLRLIRDRATGRVPASAAPAAPKDFRQAAIGFFAAIGAKPARN